MAEEPAPAHTAELLSERLQRSFVWRVKLRLQFTGWLQYLPNLSLALGLGLLGGLAWLGPWPWLTWGLLGLGGLALGNLVFDLLTVRWKVRPPEPLPRPRTELDAFELMRARVSCRSFQTRDLTDAHREALVSLAARVTKPEHTLGEVPIRLEYLPAALTVWPVVGAHEFFVAIAPKAYHRGAVIDVGRSLEQVVHEATRLGVATCWIGPGADHASVIAHLGDRFDPERDHVICVCALGYASRFKPLALRLSQRVMRRRLPLSELFFADVGFEEPLNTEAPPFSAFGRCYEVCQWAPSSYNSQTTRCAGIAREGRVVRFDFASATDSRYYAAVALGIWCANWEAGCEALGIPGRFVALSAEERGVAEAEERFRYDVSWVALDTPDGA